MEVPAGVFFMEVIAAAAPANCLADAFESDLLLPNCIAGRDNFSSAIFLKSAPAGQPAIGSTSPLSITPTTINAMMIRRPTTTNIPNQAPLDASFIVVSDNESGDTVS
uniref:Uncharacterized protein n=1 Tax=Romanomermis culicivorax TaxID=13658 RepID=A0A915KBR1_ROMCU